MERPKTPNSQHKTEEKVRRTDILNSKIYYKSNSNQNSDQTKLDKRIKGTEYRAQKETHTNTVS